MKRFITTLLVVIMPLIALAQKEQDFASRFMSLYGSGTSVTCTTVSPLMIERMMELPKVEENEQARQVLSQLKSIRVLTNSDVNETPHLFTNAKQLAEHNPSRYKLHAEEKDKKLYVRRRGQIIVEVVLFMEQAKHFSLIDLTGNMNDTFLEQVLTI